MNIEFRDRFTLLWRRYFNNAGLPIVFHYTENAPQTAAPPRCIINGLMSVFEGETLSCTGETVGCSGGKRYLGFADSIRPNFEYFLSYGITGKMKGERYVKTPEMVRQIMSNSPPFKAPASYIVFKRWDKLEKPDNPDVVIFFATPDVMAGLFTLARYDETRIDPVIAPFGSGCSTIVQTPYLESKKDNPRAVIGMFDPSARIYVPKETLSFAVPYLKFERMVNNMEESFLNTETWTNIRKRIP